MPTKIASESPFRLTVLLWTLLGVLVVGYVAGISGVGVTEPPGQCRPVAVGSASAVHTLEYAQEW